MTDSKKGKLTLITGGAEGSRSTGSRGKVEMVSTDAPLRLFFAIELPDAARARIVEFQRRELGAIAEARAGALRLTAPENLHLTLRYIGSASQSERVWLSEVGASLARSVAPFELSVVGAGLFPNRGKPRVFWLGVQDDSGRVDELLGGLSAALSQSRFGAGSALSAAHITIARVKDFRIRGAMARLARASAQRRFCRFDVERITLYKSELTPNRAVYDSVGRHDLSGGE